MSWTKTLEVIALERTVTPVQIPGHNDRLKHLPPSIQIFLRSLPIIVCGSISCPEGFHWALGIVLINIMMLKLPKYRILFLLVIQIWSLFHVKLKIVGILMMMVPIRKRIEIFSMMGRLIRRLINWWSSARVQALLAYVLRWLLTDFYRVATIVRAFNWPLTNSWSGNWRLLVFNWGSS